MNNKKCFKNIDKVIEFACEYDGESKEFDCDIVLMVDGIKHIAHTVSVSYKDLLFYCEGATLNYLIDDYGCGPVLSLYEIDED